MNSQAKDIELNTLLTKIKLEQQKILDYDKKIENLKNKHKDIKKHGSNRFKTETRENVSELAVNENEIEDEDLVLEDLIPGINDESDEEEDDNKYRPIQVIVKIIYI